MRACVCVYVLCVYVCVRACVCVKKVLCLNGHRYLYSLGVGVGGGINRPEVIVSKFISISNRFLFIIL